MKKLIPLFVLSLVVSAGRNVSADNGLFSSIRIGAVYAPDSGSVTKETPDPSPQTVPDKPVQAESLDLTLIGKWVASRNSTEAFALQLNAEKAFQLVSISQNRSRKSTGRFTIQGETLTLQGTDGTHLSSRIRILDNEFEFTPVSAQGNAATLKFKRVN